MKKVILVLLILSVQTGNAQDCNTQAANKPSTTVRFQDEIMKPGDGSKLTINLAKINPNLSKAESWVKGLLKNFTGAKLAYSNDYFFDYTGGSTKDFYNATGIKGFYSAKMRFYAYYCYDNNNKIFTEGESGSFVAVNFNNVFASSLCKNVGVFTINGKYAFQIFEKSRTEGRIDYYEQLAKSNVEDKFPSKHEYIIIRNIDQPVFIPINRKEYLEQMQKDVENYVISDAKSSAEIYTRNIKQFEAEMKVYKEMDKSYTVEKEAKRRKWFEEDQGKLKNSMSKSGPNADAAKAVIIQYLKKPTEWLSRPLKHFHTYNEFNPKGLKAYFEELDVFTLSSEEETRTQVVTLNPAYYNKLLGADVPQLIMLHLPKGSYPHMKKVADLVKQPGALAPLEAILNPGKQTVPEIQTTVTSVYTLKYLPKLNQLTPLTVPADMKPSVVVTGNYTNAVPAAKINVEMPLLSPKLKQLPALPFTADTYKNYVQELYTKISAAIKPEEKKKADDYVRNKKLTQSKDISNTAFAAWLQNTPKASLYLYSKAVTINPADALAANNFAAFLIMGGLQEKAIPILEYWNKQKPGESSILSNLGNAYYRLGDIEKATNFLKQAVEKDSLQPTANKILCIIYLKKGDIKKAEKHGTKSITTSHDEQVIFMLRQLNSKVKSGEIMSRFPQLPAKEFPLLKRTLLPAMPSSLDDMDQFEIELNAIKKSLQITIEDIEAKAPKVSDDTQQKILMASLTKGISVISVKAQYIIMDGLQTYQRETINEDDVFKYNLKKLNIPYNAKIKAIAKKYDDQINKLEGGEAGDEDKMAALELAKCKEINTQKQIHLAELSQLVNQYAQRRENISRKFFRDYANWAPWWMPETTISFPSIERDYLKDVLNILGEYRIIKKMNCTVFEPLPGKDGTIQKWEDEYCANFKGKIGVGPAKITWTCNSWGIEGGEGIVGAFEMNFANDGAFEEFTFEAGLGETWSLGDGHIVNIEASTSIKEFIKVGPDKTTGKWGVKDFGIKTEGSIEGKIGNVSAEVKVLELSIAVNAGLNVGGVVAPILNLN